MLPVSVCIPVYNGEKYLRQCIDSILSQSFSDFEVVIIDDQSDDASFAIAKKYWAEDHRVRIFQNDRNLGLVNNWNRCIELSHGEWIKFVFQDDLLESNCLEQLVKATSTLKKMIVCKRKIIFDGVSKKTKKSYYRYINKISMDNVFEGKTDISRNDYCYAIMNNLRDNFVGEPTSVMLHRTVFDLYGMFNANFVQLSDLEFWSRVGSNCGIKYVPEVLSTFRVHPRMTTSVNQYKNNFRMKVLDVLLLYHEFAYNPHFKFLRDNTIQNHLYSDFEILLALEGIRAYFIVKVISIKKSKFSISPLAEWKSFLLEYPNINQSPYYRKFKLFGPLFINRCFLEHFYKHFLRFSN